MEITCKNCDHNFQGNYCNNCGQSAQTHPINYHYIWHDIQHGIFHVDKGLFYTLSQMFTRPGAAIREFIEGKRVKHFKPVALIFLMGTIYQILHHYLHIKFKFVTFTGDPNAAELGESINEWFGSHYSLFILFATPFFALGSFIFFQKKHYNLVEHTVLNCFATAQKMVLQFAILPLLYFFKDAAFVMAILGISFIVDFFLTYWVYSNVFTEYSKISCFFRTLVSYLLSYAVLMIVLTALVVMYLVMHGVK